MGGTADLDPIETGEWVDSLRAVLHHHGSARATYLLERLTDEAQYAGATRPFALNSPYVNTIPPEREERASWDRDAATTIALSTTLNSDVASNSRGP
jgi:pyruvate dehydrogenase E1 component